MRNKKMPMKKKPIGFAAAYCPPLHAIAKATVIIAIGSSQVSWITGAHAQGTGSQAASRAVQTTPALPRMACSTLTSAPSVVVPMGKSQVISLGSPAIRLIGAGRPTSWIGQPIAVDEKSPGDMKAASQRTAIQSYDGIADTEITLLSPSEVLVVGRRQGTSNMIVQDREGRCVVRDIVVSIDPAAIQAKLTEMLPDEKGIRVSGADNGFVLSGTVSDSVKLDQALSVAATYGDGKKVVNLMRVTSPQQVMLEVKIAEVSKGLLDRFGIDYSRALMSGSRTNFISGIFGGRAGSIGSFNPAAAGAPALNGSFGAAVGDAASGVGLTWSGLTAGNTRGGTLLGLNMQAQDGIVRVLAEPNIMAISGQSASFLSGGKIFIPVSQKDGVVTLSEKEFGVGLIFTPTVLDGRINLKVMSEVSELSQTGTPFTTFGGVTAILPSMTSRKVDTTVQLGDGQSFAVAGLIKNNITEALNKFPGLGDVPVVGALFRSTEFQNDKTELMFVVTPRLVQPSNGSFTLPTDNHIAPSRADVMIRGAGEAPEPAPSNGNSPASPAK